MAQASDRRQQVYDPLSPQQLLLPIRGSREMQEFYDEFCREIAAKTTEEGMEDMLLTTRAYVQCNGDFKKTAKKLKPVSYTHLQQVTSMTDLSRL